MWKGAVLLLGRWPWIKQASKQNNKEHSSLVIAWLSALTSLHDEVQSKSHKMKFSKLLLVMVFYHSNRNSNFKKMFMSTIAGNYTCFLVMLEIKASILIVSDSPAIIYLSCKEDTLEYSQNNSNISYSCH